MKKVKVKPEEPIQGPKIEHYSNYKSRPMVRIKGNFYGGGFNVSKNKILAILDNIDDLKEFAAGKYDKEIADLGEDEVLVR